MIIDDLTYPKSRLYFECHITIDPVFEAELAHLTVVSGLYNFRVANLLMQRRKEDTPERSRHDAFLTGRHKDFDIIRRQALNCVAALKNNGFVIRRVKIEDTLFDTKAGDFL